MNDADKQRIVDGARWFFDKTWPNMEPASRRRACLYWTCCAIVTSAVMGGPRLVLQAGSARYRRLPHGMDDGKVSTHFSYEWEKGAKGKNLRALRAGVLPEMHVWAGDPKTQEIVDLTTCFIPEQCQELAGEEWLMPAPPDFIWQHRTLDGWSYEVCPVATMVAMSLVEVIAPEMEHAGSVIARRA